MGRKIGVAQAFDTGVVDDLVGRIAKNGVQTAGKSFIGAAPIKNEPIVNKVAGINGVDISNYQRESGAPLIEKAAAVNMAALNVVRDVAKRGAKNVYNLFATPFRHIPDVAFALTHGGVFEENYYANKYNETKKQLNFDTKSLSEALESGRISRGEYEKQLADVNAKYSPMLEDYSTRSRRALERNGFHDWQTGQYKPNVGAGDIFNIADAAITAASIGTFGTVRGVAAETAKRGIFKEGEGFLLESLNKVLGANRAIGITARLGETKAASTIRTIDKIVADTIEKVPGFREYTERQIAKLGGDATAKNFVKNAVAEVIVHAPLREMNMDAASKIVTSTFNGDFFNTPEGKTWLDSGAANALILAGMALEGGPVGFLLKSGKKVFGATKVLTFGDEAVRTLSQIDQEVLTKLGSSETAQEVQKILQDYASNGPTGTRVDHFFSLLSGNANDAALGYKWLAEHPENLPAFKSVVASLLTNEHADSYMQAAVAGIMKDLLSAGKEINIDNAMEHIFRWQKAGEIGDEISKLLIGQNKLAPGMKGVVIAFSQQQEEKLIKGISETIKDVADKAKQLGDVPRETILQAQKDAAIGYIQLAVNNGESWAQHDGIVKDIVEGISEAKRAFSGKGKEGESIINAIRSRSKGVAYKGVPSKLANQLKELGYVFSVPENLKNPFVPIAEAATTKIETMLAAPPRGKMAKLFGFGKNQPIAEASKLLGDDVVAARGAAPGFQRVGNMLKSVGLGLDESTKESYRLIQTNAANLIDEAQIGVGGIDALNRLEDYANGSRTITDLRQMTKNEIAKALGISKQSAAEVQRALIQSHLDVPIYIRGAGDKIVDFAMKNPLQRLYGRIQGAARYSYNPFFKTQEIVETKLLAAGATNGMTLFNPKSSSELNAIVKKMEDYRLLEGTRYGEAATNVALGRVTAQITKFQKRDLARVIDFMAEKLTNGNVDELLTHHTSEVIDVIRPIVQYPSRGVLNSNMARFLNLAAFPSRYNLKVTGLAMKAIAQQPPAIQAAIVRGIADFDKWLYTPDGLAWRQTYAPEIAAFKWITPLGNLEWTMKTLQGRHNSFSDLGQVGGLPFGVFTQILNNQGIIDTQAPYVDPKTGEIYAKRIPENLKARMSLAIIDLLGSMFTYPGRTLGLPGKGQLTREAAFRITGSSNRDFSSQQYTPEDLSPTQRLEQQYWYNRANPQTGQIEQPMAAGLSVQVPSVSRQTSNVDELIKRFSKSEIREAKGTGKTASKKQKAPVPFQQIVNR